MTTYTITQTQRQQLLDFCTFLWRDVPLNDYAQEQLDLVLAEIESLQSLTPLPEAAPSTSQPSPAQPLRLGGLYHP